MSGFSEKNGMFGAQAFVTHGAQANEDVTSLSMVSAKLAEPKSPSPGKTRRITIRPQSTVDSETSFSRQGSQLQLVPPEKKPVPQLASWREDFFNYSQNTTFHGPRLIFEKQPFFLRRIIWVVIFLSCTVILLIQLATNVKHYGSWPVSVDVKINYNESIVFPAFTICNANSFRSTAASEMGYYKLLNRMYSPNVSSAILKQFNLSHITLDDLYTRTAHTKQDFIVSCAWDEGFCSPDDFTESMTDFGLCYTFNHARNKKPVRQIYQTGAKGGLRLQLNIEQYEYMRGPNEGAGLKILLHHPNDVPLVRDYGSAIPPGTHGIVALKIIKVNNLPPNYGKCNDSVKLAYFGEYSVSNCFTDCKEKFLEHKCGCKDIYMPQNHGYPSSCTVRKYEECMKSTLASFFRVRQQCECPIPCTRHLYESAVSYATTSNFDIENLVKQRANDKLRSKYVHAREVSERVDEVKRQANQYLINNFTSAVNSLDSALNNVSEKVINALDAVEASYQQLQDRLHFHREQALLKVKTMLQFNFIRAKTMFTERAFHYVTMDFYGVSSCLWRALDVSNTTMPGLDMKQRRLAYLPMQNMLQERIVLINRADRYVSKVYSAYQTGKPLLTYPQSYKSRYDKSYVSKPLLKSGQSDLNKYFRQTDKALSRMKSGITMFMSVGEQFVKSGIINETYFKKGKDTFNGGAINFNSGLHWFVSLGVNKPLDVINSIIAELEVRNRTLYEQHVGIKWRTNQIKEILVELLQTNWRYVLDISDLSAMYLLDATTLKSELCENITSIRMEKQVNSLSFIFEDLTLKLKDLQVALNEVNLAYQSLWQFMLDEVHTKPFYTKLHEDVSNFLNGSTKVNYPLTFAKLLGISTKEFGNLTHSRLVQMMNADFVILNLTSVDARIEEDFKHFNSILTMSKAVDVAQDEFLSQYRTYKETATLYLKNNEVGLNFFRENFMNLDVFVQELSYEEITQQKAYDIAKLLSDIGGLMGLFIGGSVVTIFELIDVFVHHSFRNVLQR